MTKEKIEEVLNYSVTNNVSEKEACKILGINYGSLYAFKKKFGIKPHPMGKAPFTARGKVLYGVNESFFEVPNLLNCYYAGFFAADGNIAKDKRHCTITLSSKDRCWLEVFKQNIEFDGPIRDFIMKGKYPSSSIVINSKKIAHDLEVNFNITPAKSLTLIPPNISDESLIDAFICGYIDGDGSIGLSSNNGKQESLKISILGTFEMMLWIKQRINVVVGKEFGSIVHKKTHSGKVFTLSFGDKNGRTLFLSYYDIKVPKLERKWCNEYYEYCINYKKRLPICRRKGVNIFNMEGELIKHCETLLEAEKFTGVSYANISRLCKINDNRHSSHGFMFSRGNEMKPYEGRKQKNYESI